MLCHVYVHLFQSFVSILNLISVIYMHEYQQKLTYDYRYGGFLYNLFLTLLVFVSRIYILSKGIPPPVLFLLNGIWCCILTFIIWKCITALIQDLKKFLSRMDYVPSKVFSINSLKITYIFYKKCHIHKILHNQHFLIIHIFPVEKLKVVGCCRLC